jgi:hypothetical protein
MRSGLLSMFLVSLAQLIDATSPTLFLPTNPAARSDRTAPPYVPRPTSSQGIGDGWRQRG